MAKKEKELEGLKELNVWTGENWSLRKDGTKILIESGTGFYNEKRDEAKVNLVISIQEK